MPLFLFKPLLFKRSVEMIYKGKNFVGKEALIEPLLAKGGNRV